MTCVEEERGRDLPVHGLRCGQLVGGMAAHGSGWGLPCRLTRGSREVAGGKEKKRKLAEERAGKKEMREL